MTRADVVGGDDVADVHLAGVEVDLDARDAGRPAEGRVGVAAVGLVVEADARVGLEPLVDAERAVRRARTSRYVVGEGAAGRAPRPGRAAAARP